MNGSLLQVVVDVYNSSVHREVLVGAFKLVGTLMRGSLGHKMINPPASTTDSNVLLIE